jgi:hypothetical protein
VLLEESSPVEGYGHKKAVATEPDENRKNIDSNVRRCRVIPHD